MNLRIQLRTHQLDNALQVREMRREVAIINTVMTEKKKAQT